MKKVFLILITILCEVLQSQNAVQFNGTNAYIAFGNNANLGLQQFSLECWFKRLGSGATTSTGTGGVTGVPLISKGRGEADGSNLDMNYFLGIRQTDSTLVADFEEGSLGTTPGLNHPIIGVTKLARNVWYHVAVTYNNSIWKLYLNGQLESQVTVNQPTQYLSIQHSAIASACTSNGTAQGFFNGIIDEVRIWNSAKTQNQIISTLNSAITGTASGLVARWGLNEGTGTSVASSAGVAINGTITGANWSWVNMQAPFNMNIAPSTPTLVAPADSSKCNRKSTRLTVNVADLNGDSLWVKFYGRKKNKANDFSIIPLPDTQYYTSQINGATNALYKSQMNWVVAKKDSLNIKFISGLGDCVENGDNGGNDVEWKRADTSMKIVETATTLVFPTGIPYGLNVGNHDQSPIGNPNGTTAFYNQYFGVSRFNGRNYWGGNYGANADNNYQLFSAEGMDFIVINLEYDPLADPAVLSWATGLLQTYSTRKAIISSHWFLNLNGTFGAQGQATYNAIKNYPNVFLMLCGHVAGEARRTDVFNGNTIHCLLSDYQGRTNGGNGWIRIVKFRPSLGKINVYTYSPALNQSESDADSQFILDYDFGPNYLLIDSIKVASGQSASVNWNNLMNATDYEWFAKAGDQNSVTSSTVYNFQTNAYQVKLSSDTSVCFGPVNIIPLSGSASSLSLVWMNGSTSQSIVVSTSTVVIINATDSLNCLTKDTMNVTINNVPQQPGFIVGNVNPCVGSIQNYSVPIAVGATSYSWTLANSWIGTSTTISISVTTGTTNGNILVYAQNICGISPTRSLAIVLNNPPLTPTAITGNSNQCIGVGLVTYSVSSILGAANYSWSLPGTWTGTANSNVINALVGSGSGVLSVIASNSCGLSNPQTLSVTVNPLPTLTISSISNSICYGSTLLLSAGGANSYTWNIGPISASISITPTTNTSYSVIGTDNNGCVNSASKTITVNPLPSLSIIGNSATCLGESVTFSASGATSYTWSNLANTSSILVTPIANTTYTLNGTDINGCQNTLTKNIVVNALPSVIITGNSNVCIGNALNLVANGASSYTWNTQANTSSVIVTPTTNTSYTVIGADVNGCTNSAVKSITVNALPILSVAGNTAVCFGNSLILVAVGANTYSWTNSIVSSSISVAPISNTAYTVIGTDLNGCSNSSVKNITVNALPVITISGANTPVCSGSTVVLNASGATTFTWNTQMVANSISAVVINNSTYSVVGMDVNGCFGSAVKNVTVNPLPSISISSNSLNICSGQTATLNASGATSYTWSNNANSSIINVSPSATATYSVTGTDANGCTNFVSQIVTVNPLPIVSIVSNHTLICAGETASLTAFGATTYSWSVSQGVSLITITPSITATYSVIGVDANNCSNTAAFTQSVSECTAIRLNSLPNTINVYPNPNNGVFNIDLTTKGNFSVELYNSLGQKVYAEKIQTGHNTISLDVIKGIYFFNISENKEVFSTGKIIVE